MTLDMHTLAEHEHEQQPMTIPTFLTAPDADIILHTSDSYNLRVYRRILSASSPFFATLLSLPQPADTPSVPSIDIPEPASVIIPLLQLIYPVSDPRIDSLDTLAPILGAAIKYNVKVASKNLRRMLVDEHKGLVYTSPRRVYAIACRYHLREEMRDAANATLALEDVFLEGAPVHAFDSNSQSVGLHEDLKWIAAWEYCRLVHLRRERVVGVLRTVLEDLDDEAKTGSILDPSTLGIMLPQAVLQGIVAHSAATNDTDTNRDHDQVESETLGADEDHDANMVDDADTDMEDDDEPPVGYDDDSDVQTQASGLPGSTSEAQGNETAEASSQPIIEVPRKPTKCTLCNSMHYTGSSPPRWYTTWQRLAGLELAKRPTVQPALDLLGDTNASTEEYYGTRGGRGQQRAKRLNRGSPSPSLPSPSSSTSTSRHTSPSPTSQSTVTTHSTPSSSQTRTSRPTQALSKKRTRARTLSPSELEAFASLKDGVFGMPFLARCVKESECDACAGSVLKSAAFLEGLKRRVANVRDGDEIF